MIRNAEMLDADKQRHEAHSITSSISVYFYRPPRSTSPESFDKDAFAQNKRKLLSMQTQSTYHFSSSALGVGEGDGRLMTMILSRTRMEGCKSYRGPYHVKAYHPRAGCWSRVQVVRRGYVRPGQFGGGYFEDSHWDVVSTWLDILASPVDPDLV